MAKDTLNVSDETLLLLKKAPALGFIFMQLSPREDKNVPTMGVNGSLRLLYNKEWFSKLSFNERVGVLAHEASHVLLEHVFEDRSYRSVFWKHKMDYDPQITNIAMDAVINSILEKHGFKLPKGSIKAEDKFLRMSSEEVLDELLKQVTQQGGKGKGKSSLSGMGNVFDDHSNFGKSDKEGDGEGGSGSGKEKDGKGKPSRDMTAEEAAKRAAEVEKIRQRIRAALLASPDGISADFEAIISKNKKVDWRRILKNAITSVKAKEEMKYPNRHLISVQALQNHRVIYGKKRKVNVPKVLFFLDVSGSISLELCEEFLAVVRSLDNYSREFEVITFDHVLEGTFKPSELRADKIVLSGGGGTNFQPELDYLNEKRPDAVVWLTDGGFSDMQNVCKVPRSFAFLSGENKEFSDLFGKTIVIDE